MKRMVLLAAAGLLVAGPAVADDIAVEAPISSVTVYPQGASITRTFDFSLPGGTSVLVIDDLPLGIETSSIRVEGVGESAQIQAVLVRRAEREDENPRREELIEQLELLREDIRSLDTRRAAMEAQRQFITNLISDGPGGFAELLGQAGGGIEMWEDAWRMVSDGIFEVERELHAFDIQQAEIEEEIERILAEISELPTVEPSLELRIETAAARAAEGTIEVTYQVGSAGWSPIYDAILHTGGAEEEPSIELIRRAEIIQNSGEDWSDVALTLSTSRPSGGTQAPSVGESLVGVFDRDDRTLAAAPAEAAEAADADVVGGARFAAGLVLEESEAIADFGDFRADYIVPNPVTVESGGGTRAVRIATDEAEARLFVEAAPRFSDQAFLTAAFTLESEAPILAGRVSLFRDDAFVGNGRISFANPGEEIELGFGPDDQVRVTWSLADRETGERGLLTRISFDTREYVATVENNHDRSIEITIIDRVPVADDERVTVERLPQTTEPTEEDVDGRRGVLAWTYEYEPGESREIVNAYSISWPDELRIFGAD